MAYHGDIDLADVLYFKFTTVQVSGAPATLSGSPVISAYPNSSTTQLTAGVALTVDFDSVTGLNHVAVTATTGNGYAAGDYTLVITTGTVNSVSVVGYVVGSFSINNRSPLSPTIIGRQIAIDAAGLVDVNVVKVGPTGSGTAQTAGDVVAKATDLQSRVPAALTAAGNMKSDALAINQDTTSAANLAKTTRAIARGVVGTGSTTTSIITSSMTPTGAVADQFKGKIITFDGDTTGATALKSQSTDITASTNASAPVFTVTALTTAPVSGDTFSIT